MTNNVEVYSEMLEEMFSDYQGDYKDILKYIPLFFNLLQQIYDSKELNWEAKFKINSCFSYFAIPDDLIPDDKGPSGYLDDLFICAYVLEEIAIDYPELIQNKCSFSDESFDLISEVLNQTVDLLGMKCYEILNFIGLLRFDEISNVCSLFKTPTDLNEKVERIDIEIQELQDVLRTLIVSSGNKNPLRTFSNIKSTFNKKEWDDVERIIQGTKMDEAKYDNSHEIELERIRRKILLNMREDIFDE